MLPDVVRALRCPDCHEALHETTSATNRALQCRQGHSFDIARQGYVHFGGPRLRHTGDTAGMIDARAAFLARGHYDFIASALAALAKAAENNERGGLILDAGAGTAHHLSMVLDASPQAVGLALDAARFAIRRAARAHARANAVLCDTREALPVADATVAVVLNVFAPRNAAEFHRVLRGDGALLVVTPAAEHLHELVNTLGLLSVDVAKKERVERSLGPWFDRVEEFRLERKLNLSHADVLALIGMGPSAWHLDADHVRTRVATLPEPVNVTAAVRLARYSPRPQRLA